MRRCCCSWPRTPEHAASQLGSTICNDASASCSRRPTNGSRNPSTDKVLGFTSRMRLLYVQNATRAELNACPMSEVTAAGADDVPEVWDETGAVDAAGALRLTSTFRQRRRPGAARGQAARLASPHVTPSGGSPSSWRAH